MAHKGTAEPFYLYINKSPTYPNSVTDATLLNIPQITIKQHKSPDTCTFTLRGGFSVIPLVYVHRSAITYSHLCSSDGVKSEA